MAVLDVVLNWIHILCFTIFLGGMFIATFGFMPIVKAHLNEEARHNLVVNFIPKARALMRIVVSLLVLSGISRAILLHYTHDGPASTERLVVFGFKVLFAFVPVIIFVLAPRILGRYSKEGLCCDPDAEDPKFKACGVMTTLGEGLHYTAIAGGWLAVLGGIVLTHMH
ncbi:MAG: hypothetical protein OEV49_11545 [candidate division Zixibacteria bacterium]|nr:hypothetical protein [candidate division Zixibacteria bacterium]MDH3938287.1 hypothetical protein [candidate division Zixibacteria bacterium]MDH4035435.1 hypothetical protein [candidate division Zixibacteria bacterium]